MAEIKTTVREARKTQRLAALKGLSIVFLVLTTVSPRIMATTISQNLRQAATITATVATQQPPITEMLTRTISMEQAPMREMVGLTKGALNVVVENSSGLGIEGASVVSTSQPTWLFP